MMAGGYSNREIAESLDLSEGAIKNYVSNVLSKFGVRDRTRAVLKGIELGYVRRFCGWIEQHSDSIICLRESIVGIERVEDGHRAVN